MAEQLPEGGKIVTLDLDPKVSAIAKEHFLKSPHGEKIEHHLGDARKIVSGLNEKFDMIFIDADKGGYVHYYQTIMERGLLADDGLIVVDNTFFMGGAAHPILNRVGPFKEINEFNKVVRADSRVISVQLGIRDGVTLIRHAKKN
jgi:caffeoyl-CoA O-methyltransferase